MKHIDFDIIKPPEVLKTALQEVVSSSMNPKIFLAGSIDMGKAENWQAVVEKRLEHLPVTILNPRRDDFDPSWEQDIKNPEFRKQVDWELDAIWSSDYVLFYFDPAGQAPVTMMELGIVSERVFRGDYGVEVLVCCPEGFWRKGNVDIVCDRVGIDYSSKNLDELIDKLQIMLSNDLGLE